MGKKYGCICIIMKNYNITPKFISVAMNNRMEDSILRDNLSELISLIILAITLFSSIHAWNKLNDPPHVQQIVQHAIQPSLILIQSRKVERVITTTFHVTRVARRGGYEMSLYLGATIPGL